MKYYEYHASKPVTQQKNLSPTTMSNKPLLKNLEIFCFFQATRNKNEAFLAKYSMASFLHFINAQDSTLKQRFD